MNTGTLDTADTSTPGVATPPLGPPLDWGENEELIWIKAEIEKSTEIGRGFDSVDWTGIRERASQFLPVTTDWVLLTASARAAVHAEGLGALPRWLETLQATVSASWTTMHPALPRGLARRANYLSWFIEGVADAVGAGRVSESTSDNLKASLEILSTFDEVLRTAMGGSYPGVRLLREHLKTALEKVTPAPPSSAPQASPGSATSTAAPANGASEFPPPINDVDTADRVLSKARAALFAVADAKLAADNTDAMAFRLRRLAAWLRQTTELTLDESGRLAGLRGPGADEHQHLRGALETDYKGVVTVAEQLLERYPLWLDANYLTFLALGRGGPAFRVAAETVRAETMALVRRLPMLLDLEFSDETPLASPDTRDWLQTEVDQPRSTEPPREQSPSSPSNEDDLVAAERAAGELAAQGQIEESFKVFDDGIRTAASGRERFRWRLASGRHAVRHGRADLAISVFTGLHHEAKEARLEVWEPDLWAAVLKSILELGTKGRRQRVTAEVLALLPDIEQQLSRLDLMAAVRLKERG